MEFSNYCNVIFIDKHLKNKELEHLIHYAQLRLKYDQLGILHISQNF